jgi:hypothetical protein
MLRLLELLGSFYYASTARDSLCGRLGAFMRFLTPRSQSTIALLLLPSVFLEASFASSRLFGFTA